MQYSTVLLSALTLALAQARISFTTLPNSVEASKPVTLKWTGGDDGPVTITLKKGDSKDLKTVAVLTGNAEGNSYTWTPSKSLEDGDNYALQISQGVDEINYTGQFSVSGGSGASDSSASGYPLSSQASSTSGFAATTIETTISANSTVSRSHTVYATGTAPVASISGTGINVTRNTTFSSATPTRSHSGGLSAGTTGPSSTSAETTSAETSSAPSGSPSEGAASHLDIQIGAGLAAILGFAALF